MSNKRWEEALKRFLDAGGGETGAEFIQAKVAEGQRHQDNWDSHNWDPLQDTCLSCRLHKLLGRGARCPANPERKG